MTYTHGDARTLYRSKLHTMREAVDLIQAEDTLAVPLITGQPTGFLNALAERTDYRNLSIFCGILIEPYPVLQQPGVHTVSGFYGPIERALKAMGTDIQYLPADFIGWERYALTQSPRVMAEVLSPMDEHGYMSFGLHAGATYNAFIQAARDPNRLAIGETNPGIPYVLGLNAYGSNRIHISEIDCVVESDRPVFELPDIPLTDEDRAIAQYIYELIDDGCTVQTGIGAIPNIVAQLLAEGKKGDFGIHTEMLTDGVMHLHKAGKVTNDKGVYDGFSVGTFAAGSRALYSWLDHNREVRMLPVPMVNDPAIIRRNRKMISINGAMAVDLNGQTMSDTHGPLQYSGVGGQELFVIGAQESVGGKSTICLHATAKVQGKTISAIVPHLPLGTPVTTPRHHVQYVVTEYGVADFNNLTHAGRAAALIEIAHPDFRDELRAAAREMK
jgi:acyl-CoA hydrolase